MVDAFLENIVEDYSEPMWSCSACLELYYTELEAEECCSE